MAANDLITKLQNAQANGLSVETILRDAVLEMITYKDKDFVFTKAGFDTTEVIGANKGSTKITFMRYNPLEVDINKSQLYEGYTNDPLQIGGHTISATLEEHGAWIKITSAVRDIHLHDIQVQYLPDMVRHANETKERIAIKHINSEASIYFAGDKADEDSITAEDVLTLEDIKKGTLSFHSFLRRPHSKFRDKWVVVTSNHVMFDLLKDPELREQMIIGKENAPLKSGSLEEYTTFNTTFITTPMLGREAKKNENGVYVFDSYLIADKAYITTKLGKNDFKWHFTDFNATKDDPLGRFATFGYTMYFGAKVLDPVAIIRYKSASSYGVPETMYTPERDVASRPAPVTKEQIEASRGLKGFPADVKKEDTLPQPKPEGK